jgi:hypothetical protein
MNESELRTLMHDMVVLAGRPRLSVVDRRIVQTIADACDLDVWLCEACGQTDEEGLACYEIRRHTRRREGSAAILCSTCATKIPHGRVLSD